MKTKIIYGVTVQFDGKFTYHLPDSKRTKNFVRWYNAKRTKKALKLFARECGAEFEHKPKGTIKQLKQRSLKAVKLLKKDYIKEHVKKIQCSIRYYSKKANRAEGIINKLEYWERVNSLQSYLLEL